MKIWKWIKEHSKALIITVSIIVIFIVCAVFWMLDLFHFTKKSGTTDEVADKALKEVGDARDKRDRALKELEKQRKKELDRMSGEQRKEYEKIKGGSVEDVAEWIDNL
jgi:hypothetical protein